MLMPVDACCGSVNACHGGVGSVDACCGGVNACCDGVDAYRAVDACRVFDAAAAVLMPAWVLMLQQRC